MDALRRSVFFALAVVLGFLLLELPWNDGVFAIPQRYVVDNLLILGLGCAIVFLLSLVVLMIIYPHGTITQ